MKGTRHLDNGEIRRVSACFTATFATRNRGLFMLGVSTGGRISELLSLQIGDVYQNGKPVTYLLFEKAIVKDSEVSRAVPVNANSRHAIDELTSWQTGSTTKTPLSTVRYSRRDTNPAESHAPSNCTRHPQKRFYRGGLER